jgi:hypothetical protein
MNRQLTTSQIDVQANTGTRNVSYQGYPVDLSLYSGSLAWQPQYFADTKTDKALSGRLRSRLQGYRLIGSLVWDRSLETNIIADVLDKMPYGVSRLFWTGTTNSTGSVTNVNITTGSTTADAYNGMTITFNNANTRTITDYAGNVITVNSAVTLAGGETLNISTNANMPTVVFYAPDANNPSEKDEVILDGEITSSIESTIVRQPISINLEGVDIENTIPTYYLQ